LNKEESFNKQAMMDNNGEPVAADAGKLPLKKRAVVIFGAGEDDDGDKKPAARSSPESDAESDDASSPEARDQLEQALELIPDEEKAAYLEAVETAHQIIEDESNPVWFIRYEQCNFWAAASRLVTYWEERKSLFGDRAFLPLKLLTGEGALNEEDFTVLRCGWLALLPKDGMGRSVICIDRARLPNHELIESKLRAMFFLLSILSENIASQINGFVFIFPVSTKPAGDVGRSIAKTFVRLTRNAMPTRMMAAHFTCCLPKAGHKTFLGTIFPAAIQGHGNVFENIVHMNIVHMHVGESKHDICEKLQFHCMKPEGIPETLGGTLRLEALIQWMLAEDPDWTKCCPDKASMDLTLDLPINAPTLAAGDNTRTASECNGSTKSVQNNSEIFDSNGNEYAEWATQGCIELEETLELMPKEEKAAYTEAICRVPDLVDSESDHFRFLWYAKYNIPAAARRLVSYWECRKELFGERAFLPMTQLENGALSEDDIAVLQTGYLALLPDDTDGCAVVCYDGSRVGPSVEDPGGMSRLRCLFYMMAVVSEKRRACVDGFVGIEIASELSFEQTKGRFFELAEKVLPVHLKALHLVHSPSATAGTNKFFGTIVPATVKLLGATAHRRAHVHTGMPKEDILEKLKACGFCSEGLPECVGGMWTDDNFSMWQTERRRVEEEIHLIADVCEQYSHEPTYLGPIPKKPAGLFSIDAAPSEEGKEIEPQIRNTNAAPAEEGKEIEPQIRSTNSIYSRTKRERERLKVQALRDESTRLTLVNAELKRDNNFLEGVLATAEALIARTEHLVPPTITGCGFTTPSSIGVTYIQNGLPGSSSFGNIGAVLGPQRSFQDQEFLRYLARERRSLDSLLLEQDFVANRAALLAQLTRQQHGHQ
jgi:hypothetical protein